MLLIHNYSDSFVELFNTEKKKLKKILGNFCLIEHIGSTAIPKVDGKGIIDIMVVFENIKDIKSAVELLQNNGYILSDNKIERTGRIFMSTSGKKESCLGDVHLHITTKDNDSYLNAILFRDYLKKHPKRKKEYVDLKYQLFNKVNGNRTKYTELKSGFIKKIIDLAKKEKF